MKTEIYDISDSVFPLKKQFPGYKWIYSYGCFWWTLKFNDVYIGMFTYKNGEQAFKNNILTFHFARSDITALELKLMSDFSQRT